jgi:hypothetical protein
MRESFPQTPLFDPPHQKQKGLTLRSTLLLFLVELRGIEPLTPRLPAGNGRKPQSLIFRLWNSARE